MMAVEFWRLWRLILILAALVVSAPTGAQTPSTTSQGGARFLVYFDDFSAFLEQQTREQIKPFLSDEAKTIIADAAKRARVAGARRIVVQARASATGRAETNKYLAQTRSSIVTDQLEADGIARTLIQQEPIGQTGSNDPTVTERRVDIIIEP